MRRCRLYLLVGLLGSLIVAGCAEKKTDEELLMERAKTYWEAARIFDLPTMFHLESSSLDGRLIAADMTKVLASETRLQKYELRNPRIDGDTATIDADLTLVLTTTGGKGWDQPAKPDHWVRINGQWYHGMPKPKQEPPPAAQPAPPPAPAGADAPSAPAPGDSS